MLYITAQMTPFLVCIINPMKCYIDSMENLLSSFTDLKGILKLYTHLIKSLIYNTNVLV